MSTAMAGTAPYGGSPAILFMGLHDVDQGGNDRPNKPGHRNPKAPHVPMGIWVHDVAPFCEGASREKPLNRRRLAVKTRNSAGTQRQAHEHGTGHVRAFTTNL